MVIKAGRFLKTKREGARRISGLDQLVNASVDWFAYDRLKRSPFPSQEPPPEAVWKWYNQHLELRIKGTNQFEWTCPGCQTRIEVETNYLHTCMMFDYVFWEFCPNCRLALHPEEGQTKGA